MNLTALGAATYSVFGNINMKVAIKGWKDIPGIRGVSYRLGNWQQRSAFALRGVGHYARLRIRRDTSRPSIAAVMVGRNDDYMADFRNRLHATVEWNTRHLINEVVFVEWNPPPDRELLAYGLTEKFKNLRAYVVPAEIHQGINRNSHLQLLEYHAKNVGVRRAEAPWILVTNADAALAPDTVNKILGAKLEPDTAWTAERVDIAWRENEQQHIGLKESLRQRRFIPYHELGTGDFVLASRALWDRIRGYDEAMVKHRIGCDTRGTAQMLAKNATIKFAGSVLHLQHPTSCVEGVAPHHGEFASIDGLPYHNPENWGLAHHREVEIGERVWRLEP